jgi:hypothetical protein
MTASTGKSPASSVLYPTAVTCSEMLLVAVLAVSVSKVQSQQPDFTAVRFESLKSTDNYMSQLS